jgi:hypothetical protein
MRTLWSDQQLEEPQASVRADAPVPAPQDAKAKVLQLQRTAGNAAVARVLGTARGKRIIARKPNLQPAQTEAVKDYAMNRMAGKFTTLKADADLMKWCDGVVYNWTSENSKIGKPITYNKDDTAQLAEWMEKEYIPWWDHGQFDQVMRNLASLGGKPEYVERLLAVTDWPAGQKPRIVGHPSVTTGANYDRANHLIKISPALRDPTAALDFISFECENARRRTGFAVAQKTGAREVAELEFQSDTAYAEGLKPVYRAANWAELVEKLAVPVPLRQPQVFDASKSYTENVVKMPDKSALPSQAQRQALWYFKTEAWTQEQRREVWIASSHGEGLGSSEALYGKQLASTHK